MLQFHNKAVHNHVSPMIIFALVAISNQSLKQLVNKPIRRVFGHVLLVSEPLLRKASFLAEVEYDINQVIKGVVAYAFVLIHIEIPIAKFAEVCILKKRGTDIESFYSWSVCFIFLFYKVSYHHINHLI